MVSTSKERLREERKAWHKNDGDSFASIGIVSSKDKLIVAVTINAFPDVMRTLQREFSSFSRFASERRQMQAGMQTFSMPPLSS